MSKKEAAAKVANGAGAPAKTPIEEKMDELLKLYKTNFGVQAKRLDDHDEVIKDLCSRVEKLEGKAAPAAAAAAAAAPAATTAAPAAAAAAPAAAPAATTAAPAATLTATKAKGTYSGIAFAYTCINPANGEEMRAPDVGTARQMSFNRVGRVYAMYTDGKYVRDLTREELIKYGLVSPASK